MPDRSERREEVKLYLEYVKTVLSFAVVGSLVFAGLQWRTANQAAETANRAANQAAVAANRAADEANSLVNLNLYERVTNEWRDHLKTFVDKPNLRPYFEERKELSPQDENKEVVLALADVRLDVMDAILTYFEMRGLSDKIGGWKNTFTGAFLASPVLCARLRNTLSSYTPSRIVEIWRPVCVANP
jgi:hypothetical protein